MSIGVRIASRGPADTQVLAGTISEFVRSGDLLILSGELGAGKTAFTQGFGLALGVESQITSPTFVLIQSYDGRMPIHHVDAYRLEDLDEALDLGLPELLDGPGVTLIEWGNRIRAVLPKSLLDITITYGEGDNGRVIDITPIGVTWLERWSALEAALNNLELEPC